MIYEVNTWNAIVLTARGMIITLQWIHITHVGTGYNYGRHSMEYCLTVVPSLYQANIWESLRHTQILCVCLCLRIMYGYNINVKLLVNPMRGAQTRQ